MEITKAQKDVRETRKNSGGRLFALAGKQTSASLSSRICFFCTLSRNRRPTAI
jgi:hypothetical protein